MTESADSKPKVILQDNQDFVNDSCAPPEVRRFATFADMVDAEDTARRPTVDEHDLFWKDHRDK